MTNEVESHILEKYEIKKRLGKGAYGIVWKVVDKKSQEIVALKKIFDAFRNKTDAQRTFREIAFLKQFHGHPNIIKLYNVLKAENDKDIYLTFEFMETDLHNVIKRGNILKDVHKQYIMYQLLKATKYLHSANVIHRDQKPSNVLLDSDCFVKLCDFGLARSLSERDTLNPNPNLPPLTEYVATRWYRAPEILMASHRYTKGVDMWSLGCILGEMILGKALFPGKSTMNQIDLIMTYIPKPEKEDIETMLKIYGATMVTKVNTRPKRTLNDLIPNADSTAMDLILQLLQFNPDKRCTIEEALSHAYVKRFHNPAEEISMGHDIIPPVDDDIQLSVEEYRSKLYKFIMQNKAQKKARKRASAKHKSSELDVTSSNDLTSPTGAQSRPSSNSILNSTYSNKKTIDQQTSQDGHNGDEFKKTTKDYYQDNNGNHNNSHHSSLTDNKSETKQENYSNYGRSPASLSKENRSEHQRTNSGVSQMDRKEMDYQSYFKNDSKLHDTLPHYTSFLESSSKHNKHRHSETYGSSKNVLGNNNYDKTNYPINKSSPGFNSSFSRESRNLSGNDLRKSQAAKMQEYDIYRKSMFSPSINNMGLLNSTYSHYPRSEENSLYPANAPDKYNDELNSRPRSRSLRASYSNFSISQNERDPYVNKTVVNNGYTVPKKQSANLRNHGSYKDLSKIYAENSFYKQGIRNDSRERNRNNNNNSDGYIGPFGLDSRPPSRGLNTTWYGSDKVNHEKTYLQSDAKRHQSAPIGYSSTIAGASRPPTSGLGMKSAAKSRGQVSSDYNYRMMSRAKTPSTILERNKTPGSYHRSNSPGMRYLSSDFNQLPANKNSGSYENNSRYAHSYGSVSNNQLAHYYSRRWIS